MLRGHVKRPCPSQIRVGDPFSAVTYADWMLSRVQHYREAHSHLDKENAQIVCISPAAVDGSLSETRQF
jgi:hypothetical protein